MRSSFQKQTQEKLLSVGILSEYQPTDFVSRFNSNLHELIHLGQQGLEPVIVEVEFVVPWFGQIIMQGLKIFMFAFTKFMRILERLNPWAILFPLLGMIAFFF